MFKRVLLAASVAAVFAAPAFAEVTIYGSVRTSVEYSKGDGLTQFRLVDEKSRLGFKGEDKLDNGLTLFWKSEERLHIGGSSSTSVRNDWGNRDQVIGLKGGFGTFTAGKTTSAYADATYLSPVLDNVWGISDDSNMYNQGVNGNRTDTLKYESPSFGGFAFALSAGDSAKSTTLPEKIALSGVANYSNELFNAGAAYQRYKNATVVDFTPTAAAGTHSDSFMLGAGVKPITGLTISAHWERVKNSFVGSDTRQDNFGLGAEYEVGKWGFHGYYYQLNDIKGSAAVADSGAKHYVLTAKYTLSKNTTALAALNYIKTQANTVDTQLANGVDAGKNSNAKAISVGLRTDF